MLLFKILRNKLLLIQGIVIMILLNGCSSLITDTTIQFPYEEKLVIQGFPRAGEMFDNLIITKMLPLADSTNPESALVTDADVTIRVDGRDYKAQARIEQVRDLQSNYQTMMTDTVITHRSVYSVPNLAVEPGKTYFLTVRRNNKIAEAETRIPNIPIPISPIKFEFANDTIPEATVRGMRRLLIQWNFRATATIPVRKDECYSIIGYGTDGKGNSVGIPFSEIYTIGNKEKVPVERMLSTYSASTFVLSRILSAYVTSEHPLNEPLQKDYRPFPLSTRFFVALVAYDAPYQDYINTFVRNTVESSQNPLSAGGQTPVWNIRGDGIGIFAGIAVRETEVKVP